MFLPLILAAAALFLAGDVMGKVWTVKQEPWVFGLGMLIYLMAGTFNYFAIQQGSLSLALLILPPTIIMAGLLLGRFVFGEVLSPIQYVAAAIVLVGIGLLLWNPKLV